MDLDAYFLMFIFNYLLNLVVRIVKSVEMMRLSVCLTVSSVLVVEQCICNRIQADEMVLEWVAFSTNKNGLKLNLENLEQFEHEVAIYTLFYG